MAITAADAQHVRRQSSAADAWRVAQDAVARARIEVVPVTTDPDGARSVIASSWGAQEAPQTHLLRALAHAGSVVLTAVDRDMTVGTAFGFLGWTDGIHLHSHMTAVLPSHQSRGIGYALKLTQRAMCLDHGIDEIRWTYDPMVRRNAYFNIVRLGADVVSFHPDFYGRMEDTVNVGDRSDRFEVRWRLDSSRVDQALKGSLRAPAQSDDGVVPIPNDYPRLRACHLDEAIRLRVRAREEFSSRFNAGLLPTWMGSEGYVFTRAHVPMAEVTM